jgi:hypothetical protein
MEDRGMLVDIDRARQLQDETIARIKELDVRHQRYAGQGRAGQVLQRAFT